MKGEENLTKIIPEHFIHPHLFPALIMRPANPELAWGGSFYYPNIY